MIELIPLLVLLAASASDRREARPIHGEAHRKTPIEYFIEGYGKSRFKIGKIQAEWLKNRGRDFTKFAIHVNEEAGMPERALEDESAMGIYRTMYGIALAGGTHPPIWALDMDAFEALAKTEVPFELVRTQLPNMPYPSMLITLPEGVYLEGEEYLGRRNRITSILLMEEIPGIKWRFMGYEEKPRETDRGPDIAFTYGWLDIRKGPLRTQLPVYSEYGHSVIYQLLINLFLTLDHGYLAGRNIRPMMPKTLGRKKKFMRSKSTSPYTLINLTAATRDAARIQSQRSAEADSQKRNPPARHTVRGHWRTYWVNDPTGHIIVGTQDPETGRPFKIAKYLAPFYRGVARPGDEPRRYKVIAPGWKYEDND